MNVPTLLQFTVPRFAFSYQGNSNDTKSQKGLPGSGPVLVQQCMRAAPHLHMFLYANLILRNPGVSSDIHQARRRGSAPPVAHTHSIPRNVVSYYTGWFQAGMEAFIDTMALLFLLKTHWEKTASVGPRYRVTKPLFTKGRAAKSPLPV